MSTETRSESAVQLDSTRAMLLIKSLDNSAHLELSEWTGKWFVSARIEVSDGVILRGLVEHRDTPDEAVFALLDKLRGIDMSKHGERLVSRAYSDERREYRWNGAAFVESEGPWRRD